MRRETVRVYTWSKFGSREAWWEGLDTFEVDYVKSKHTWSLNTRETFEVDSVECKHTSLTAYRFQMCMYTMYSVCRIYIYRDLCKHTSLTAIATYPRQTLYMYIRYICIYM